MSLSITIMPSWPHIVSVIGTAIFLLYNVREVFLPWTLELHHHSFVFLNFRFSYWFC